MEAETASLHGPHKNMQIVVLKEKRFVFKSLAREQEQFF
jgi:hypothetical protein